MDVGMRGPFDLAMPAVFDAVLDGQERERASVFDLTGRLEREAPQRRGNLVLVVEDEARLAAQMGPICGYVGLQVVQVGSWADLGVVLDDRRPLAVIAPFETQHQDGGHILKSVALHDRDLPVMLLTGDNSIHQGAAEAVRDVLCLTTVCLPQGEPTFGQMVEFLASAAQRNRRRRVAEV